MPVQLIWTKAIRKMMSVFQNLPLCGRELSKAFVTFFVSYNYAF
jgi:hypothetical protein